VYSHSLSDHLGHLRSVLGVLHAHQLYAKESKCKFGVAEIDYLRHLISTFGVRADSSKLEAMVAWPIPTSIKSLRGFLGLIEYYKKFIKGYGIIAAPLLLY
jgi:hypothetical protein